MQKQEKIKPLILEKSKVLDLKAELKKISETETEEKVVEKVKGKSICCICGEIDCDYVCNSHENKEYGHKGYK